MTEELEQERARKKELMQRTKETKAEVKELEGEMRDHKVSRHVTTA